MLAARLVLVVLVLAALAPASLATSFTVTATNFAWTPSVLEVDVGDVVTFVNGGGTHTFVSDDGMGSCALPCAKTFPSLGSFDYHCGVHPGMRGVVHVGPAPTVAIASPAPGASVEGLVLVEGTATQVASGVAAVRVRLGTGAFVPATLDAPGASSTAWGATVDSRLVPNGAQTLLARVTDASGREADHAISVTVANPPEIDLRVTTLSGTTSGTTRATLTLSYRNDGNVPSGPHVLRAEYFSQGAWYPISTTSVASLAAATPRTVALHWDSDARIVGRFDVRATVDAEAQVAERDETNNVRTASAAFVTPLVEGIILPRVA